MEAVGAIKSDAIKAPEKALRHEISTFISSGKDSTNKDTSRAERQENVQSKLESIANAMDDYVRSTQRDLKISVHNGTGDIIVRVISESDGKVIREIPPQELLDLAAKMKDMTGALFDEMA